MKLDVTDCEVLSLDSGVIACPITAEQIPVLFVTVRITGQPTPLNLAIRNPRRLLEVPDTIAASTVLNGGKFVAEHTEGVE